MVEFVLEATHGNLAEAERSVDMRMASGGLRIWEDGGPVSFLAVTPAINRIVRIGPVYTPPAHRRRGYAGTAVAAASRDALATGADRCMLFTDVENPTSNKIYAEVGYERFGDWEEHAFD
jgi:predicted GNAT family acetyltransferase